MKFRPFYFMWQTSLHYTTLNVKKKWLFIVQIFPVLLAIILLFLPTKSNTKEDLDDRISNPIINELRYIVDTEHRLTPSSALQVFKNNSTNLINSHVFNLGTNKDHYWIFVDAYTSSIESTLLRLLLSVPYRSSLKVYNIDTDGALQLILEESKTKPFPARETSHRFLSSKQFDVSKQTDVNLLVDYEVIGSSYLPFTLVSEAELNQITADDSIGAAFFYSFSIAAIIIFLLFALAMMNPLAAMYGILFILGLLVIASMEGFAFKYLWPQHPQWNTISPLILLYLLSSFGLWLSFFATTKTPRNKSYRRGLLLLAVLSLALGLLSFTLPFVTMLYAVSVLMGLMFLALAYSVTSTTSLVRKRNAISAVVVIPLALFVVLLTFATLDISFLSDSILLSAPRIIYIIGSLGTMATIMAQVSGLRLDHEKALENELALMKREAETNKALFEAEQNYSRAKEIARLRQEQLATASHDMRQPLVSLRSTMDAIALHESDKVRTQLRNAFDYLENLCNTYLESTRPNHDVVILGEENNVTVAEKNAPYAVNLIIDTATRMFTDEAQHKGLSLRVRHSSAVISQPPLIVMRIVTNLLSNAIKHTKNGKILLGVRHRRGFLSIQIIDTGSDMTEQQLETLSKAYEKGPDSTGEGLGLAICRQQAEQNGMQLNIRSTLGKGTNCSLEIPI